MRIGPYVAYGQAAFQRQFAYRIANVAGLFTNVFFLFFRANLVEACVGSRDAIAGYTTADAVAWAVVTQALIMVVPQWGTLGVGDRVRDGQIAMDLVRPVDFVGMQLARRLGMSAYYLLVRFLPVFAVGALAGMVGAPSSAWALFLLLPSIVLAATIAISLLLLAELSAFWLETDRGVKYLAVGLVGLLSGLILPVSWFPDGAQLWIRALPFPYTMNLPVELYLGKIAGSELVLGLTVQAVWAVALVGACRVAFARGARRLVVHGG